MDLRVTTTTGHDTIITYIDGIPRERIEPWGIYTIEGIPGVGPRGVTQGEERGAQTVGDEGWTYGEWVATGVAIIGLLAYGIRAGTDARE
ncbi:hypothetical protein NliqN6_1548 [Naganishia liquefaciens]|uniref:Uncharacterized protein n=1 Tax=Naganishia liquefaciens TaxID=104408 RepID=A0A8H3TQL4_9TREE|nr:hypothetical protein NliqN6_1548 [Naganishia liquefaciens]